MLEFTVRNGVLEPERYSEIIMEKYLEYEDNLYRARQKLEVMAGPATHSFLFSQGDRMLEILAAAKEIFSNRQNPPEKDLIDRLATYSAASSNVVDKLTLTCRSDFQGKE